MTVPWTFGLARSHRAGRSGEHLQASTSVAPLDHPRNRHAARRAPNALHLNARSVTIQLSSVPLCSVRCALLSYYLHISCLASVATPHRHRPLLSIRSVRARSALSRPRLDSRADCLGGLYASRVQMGSGCRLLLCRVLRQCMADWTPGKHVAPEVACLLWCGLVGTGFSIRCTDPSKYSKIILRTSLEATV